MINHGFIQSVQIAATATNLLDSGFGSLIAEFTDGVITPKHIINTPAQIDLTGFHESRGERVKDSQKDYDITIIDETGNWKVKAAISALNTWAKHSKVIIIIANRLPTYINDWIEANTNYRQVRLDYWENPFCPIETLQRHENLRISSPELWRAEVLYSETTISGQRIFNLENINRMLTINSLDVPQGIRNVVSVDVGGETGDSHCIIHLRQLKDGGIYFAVERLYNASRDTLIKDVKYVKSDTDSDIEIWDASGGGGFVLDFHCPRKERQKQGIFEFRGNDSGNNNKNNTEYYNRRSEAYFLLAECMADNMIHIVADNEDKFIIDRLREELMATVIDEKYELKIAEKAVIKRNLAGKSPDILDSLTMGVWYLLTQNIKHNIIETYSTPVNVKIDPGYIG